LVLQHGAVRGAGRGAQSRGRPARGMTLVGVVPREGAAKAPGAWWAAPRPVSQAGPFLGLGFRGPLYLTGFARSSFPLRYIRMDVSIAVGLQVIIVTVLALAA